jgi:prefoldin subunit 5
MQTSALEIYKEKCGELEKMIKKMGKAAQHQKKEYDSKLKKQTQALQQQYDERIQILENQLKEYKSSEKVDQIDQNSHRQVYSSGMNIVDNKSSTQM